ncbi:polysaccharide biosynthesis protein [Arthrobacter sp. Hiyo8]|nr:polysaccharide biosynthesis protein [Arthrobacter sp. Hiyo8]
MTHLALGAAGALGLGLLGPWASAILFSDANKADTATSVFYGISFFFLSASTPSSGTSSFPPGARVLSFCGPGCRQLRESRSW